MRVAASPATGAPGRVSVVVPCYNYGRYVGAAVDSALTQEGVDVEVIVVDDASPDGSGAVVRALAERDPRVAAVVHGVNRRHIATYNDGLARAGGDYVVLLSADDLLAPGALARAVGVMRAAPDVGLVYGFSPSFAQRPPASRPFLPRVVLRRGERWIERVCATGQNPVCTPTAVMRRDVLQRTGGYDARLPHTADLLMWLRAAAVADVAYVAGVDQAYYRVHGANMHATDFAHLADDLEQRREAFRVFAEESLGGDTRAGRQCLAAATRALVREAGRARRRLDPAEEASAASAAALVAFA
ncbi:MAG: glycosyltransferase, partial [Kineosporiaceae bacterium]